MAQDLPLSQVLAQETALVLPPQRAPQASGAGSHSVDHLSPIQAGVASTCEIRTECGMHLLQSVRGTERIELR